MQVDISEKIIILPKVGGPLLRYGQHIGPERGTPRRDIHTCWTHFSGGFLGE